ncbi:DNA polymerase III subunit beta [Metamycoplasma buccale]|uniref:DNA polymerase III subunit beta n=1 Tax=Metamycoplasma buccale TaxID=55602 RepID=UPI00398E3CAE
MEITINKLILDEAIERVARAVDQNPFIPAMKGVLIEVEDNKIAFTGSNGEISIKHTIETSMDAKIITPGRILIEMGIFRNIIKKLDGDLNLKSDDKNLFITTEYDKYNLNLYSPQDFPAINFTIYGETLKIKWDDLKKIVRNVSFAASNNEMYLILCCVNIAAKNKKLFFKATDRYRYAEEAMDIDSDVEFNVSILAKNLRDLLSFEFKGEVTLNISEHKIAFEIDNTIIQSKVIEQIYQDVSKIIPKEFATHLIIDKKELNNLLNKASVIITENYNKIRLHIDNEFLTISSTREEIANAEVKTKNFKYDGDELKLTINSKYLREAISVFDDQISLLITKDKLRIVVKSDSNQNNIQLFTPQKGF